MSEFSLHRHMEGGEGMMMSPSPAQQPDGAHVGHWCAILTDDDDEEGIMEDISEVIPREFLNCRLCNEELHNPKLLPCLHSFCHHCLTTYMTAQHHPASKDHPHHHHDQKKRLSCPECGTEMKAEDPELLPDNVLARRLSCPSVPTTPRDRAHCAPCGQQGRGEAKAVVHCANCEESLCDECANTHALQVETSSHKVEPLHRGRGKGGGGGEEGREASMARMDSVENSSGVLPKCCDCYDTYDIDSMYCVDCELALCADCYEGHDKTHRCAELSAIAENFTAKIQEPVEELKRDSQTLSRMLSNLDRAERYAGKLQRDVQTRVRRRTRVLCGLIREYESVLLQEVERRHHQNLEAIQHRRLAASQHAASISAVTELTEKLLQFGSEEEKVALRRKVGRRVRELCEADLPSDPLEMTNLRLYEPSVTVETICDLFGELRTDMVHPGVRRRVLTASQSLDSARTSVSESVDDNVTELTELEEEEEGDGEEEGGNNSADSSLLSNSDRSEALQAARRRAQEKQEPRRRHHSDSAKDHAPTSKPSKGTANGLERSASLAKDPALDLSTHSGEDKADASNSSFQSSGSAQDVPTQLLDNPHKELVLPDLIARDNIKGVGVNSGGDIIIATMATLGGGSKSAIYILEQHGIVRGQIPLAANWNVHSVAADGRVAMIVPRGDNRYKVKVMAEDGSGGVLADVHLESFGLNFATATSMGHLLVASNRYAKLSGLGSKAAKSGGNVAVYDKDGRLEKRITDEDLAPTGMRLLEKPHWLALDSHNNVFVADSATHCVTGFTWSGLLLFQLGNSDMEDLYQGPDTVCVDRSGHVIVTDKKEGRIDVINYQGQLLKCLFPTDPIRFVCPTPNKLLLILPTEGTVKFYEYLS